MNNKALHTSVAIQASGLDGLASPKERGMAYSFAIGTDDPRPITAGSDAEAIIRTIARLRSDHRDDLRDRPEAVLTLFGPDGLVTGPSERLDEFVERQLPSNPAADPDRLQPGDSAAPDCNTD